MTRTKLNISQSSQLDILEFNCKLILECNGVKFVGVIRDLGNLIISGFRKRNIPMGNANIRRMMYMQLKLDLDMRKDYDELFGPVDYVVSKRGKVTKKSIHAKKNMIMLITDKGMNYESIIKKTNAVFESSLEGF